jgi:hypothetical protein
MKTHHIMPVLIAILAIGLVISTVRESSDSAGQDDGQTDSSKAAAGNGTAAAGRGSGGAPDESQRGIRVIDSGRRPSIAGSGSSRIGISDVSASRMNTGVTLTSIDALLERLQQTISGKGPNRYTELREIAVELAAVAEQDVDAVHGFLKTITNDSERRIFMSKFLEEMAKSNPSLAYEFALKVEDSIQMYSTTGSRSWFGRTQAITSVIRGWAGSDPAGAAAWVMEFPPGSERAVGMRSVADLWSRQDSAAALEWAFALPDGKERAGVITTTARQWSSSNLKGALNYLNGLDSPTEQAAFIEGIMVNWARKDPAAAIETVLSLPESASRKRSLDSAVQQWAHKDPSSAVSWLKNGGESSVSMHTLNNIVVGMLHKNAAGALEFAAGIENERTRDYVLGSAASQLVRTDPAAAIDILRSLPDGSARRNATNSLILNWSRTDPKAAAAWVEQFPAGRQQQQGYNELAMQWARRDNASAGKWIKSLPDSTAKNSAVVAFAAAKVNFTDHKAMSEWRRLMMQPNLTREAAVDWLDSAPLDETVREQAKTLF